MASTQSAYARAKALALATGRSYPTCAAFVAGKARGPSAAELREACLRLGIEYAVHPRDLQDAAVEAMLEAK